VADDCNRSRTRVRERGNNNGNCCNCRSEGGREGRGEGGSQCRRLLSDPNENTTGGEDDIKDDLLLLYILDIFFNPNHDDSCASVSINSTRSGSSTMS
jgi:hypothetical protein